MNVRVSALDLAARVSVLTAIENAERRFLKRADDADQLGHHAEAQGAMEYAKWCHRAWLVEYHDPKPEADE